MARRERRPDLLTEAADLVAAAAIVVSATTHVRRSGEVRTRAGDAEEVAAAEPPTGIMARIDGWQRRHAVVGFPLAVLKKFGDDRAGRLAALVAYYGFFSVFPLLLVAVTIIGYAVDDTSASELEESALAQIPVLGDRIGSEVEGLQGSGLALAIGILTALWAGLAATQAAQDGVNRVWDVPRAAEPNFFKKRLRSLAALVVIGGSLVLGSAASQVVALVPSLGPSTRVVGIAVSVVVNVLLFWLVFRVLTSGDHALGALVPGAVVAGIGYSLLQLLGRWYVERTVAGASDTYGTFAVVIGLLSWFYLLGQVLLLAAEVNVVVRRHLWPRALLGSLPATEADRVVAADAAGAERLPQAESIVVTFADGDQRRRP